MAKIRTGAIVQQISGSVAGNTFSHNRFGAYIRARSIPIGSSSTAAQNARAYLSTASAAWGALTEAQQKTWISWAQNNPIVDSLGEKRILTGQMAYVQIQARVLQNGDSLLSAPPQEASPQGLASLSLSLDIGAGSFGVVYTTTPLGAGLSLWLRCAVVDSGGINYVRNLLKLVSKTPAAQASPYDFQSDAEARFGTLAVGQYVHVLAQVYDEDTGLLSQPLSAKGVVVST